ncbi:DUF3566 domain-containing protein [Arsenicicoccus piscis]|uniref:DUF3566 domain-containing protein n=1 Tax=Arsenicicoccus piscis TaxID=673954 RepID=A0ABQ6HSW1_9MICO|nr:DUF3566 domain-containing protein [Arsenicicoccus piscis]GMA21564.1 hypothetical protein GCM10025862_35850 [Arsenicicoccus piscis]
MSSADSTSPVATTDNRGQGSSGAVASDRSTSATSSRAAAASSAASTAPVRRVKLRVQRVDPLSVLKLSFLVSVALGIAWVVMVAVLWMILNGMGVFSTIQDTIPDLLGDAGKKFNLMDYVGFTRVISMGVMLAILNTLFLTALATLAAFLYNVCASLVGGMHTTLTDD